MAHLQRETGDTKGAETTLVEAAKAEGAGREVFYELGILASDGGRADEAIEWFKKAHVVDAYWAKPLYQLGQSAMSKGDRAAATDYWQRTVNVAPLSPEAALAKAALGKDR